MKKYPILLLLTLSCYTTYGQMWRHRLGAGGARFDPGISTDSLLFTNNFLTVHSPAGDKTALCNKSVSSTTANKIVSWEVTVDSGTFINIGIVNSLYPGKSMLTVPGDSTDGWGYVCFSGTSSIYHNGIFTPFGSVVAAGHTVTGCVNITAGYAYFALDGLWLNGASKASIDSGSATGAAITGLTGTIIPEVSTYSGNMYQYTANFGATAWRYPGIIPNSSVGIFRN